MFKLLYRQGRRPVSLLQANIFVGAVCCDVIFMFVLSLNIVGCNAVHQQPLVDEGPYQILPDKYQRKAVEYESAGQLREAIQSWLVVLCLQQDSPEIEEKISSLRKEAKARADGHFKKGIHFYRTGRVRDARKEFLLALANDQNHMLALDYLKTKLRRPVLKKYTIQLGDTVKRIAAKEYNDPQKYFLITSFNDIDSSTELVAGTLLQIPILGAEFLAE